MLLNSEWVNNVINEEIKTCLENEDTTIQNLWDTAKAILRGRFKASHTYLKNLEKSQINNLTLNLRNWKKQSPM